MKPWCSFVINDRCANMNERFNGVNERVAQVENAPQADQLRLVREYSVNQAPIPLVSQRHSQQR